MKKFMTLLLLFVLSGCAPQLLHIPRQTEIIGFDFTPYSEQDFLITPGEYGDTYRTIGLLTFSIYPEANKVYAHSEYEYSEYRWVSEEIDADEAIELAYKEAIVRKADAITHFKISHKSKTYQDGGAIVEIDGIEVTGLLIRRTKP